MTRRSFVGTVAAAAAAWTSAWRPARGAMPPVSGAPEPAPGPGEAGLTAWRVVDYRGWIVRPEDRERLRADAAARPARQVGAAGALQ